MMRLTEAQQLAGWDSQAYFPLTKNLKTQPLNLPRHTFSAVVDERVIRNPEFAAPISVLRDNLSTSLDAIPKNSNLIHLHWINGVTTLERVRRRFPDARLVWTLHDMNPFTGACHQSLGCIKFEEGCQKCPAVRAPWQKSVSEVYQRKRVSLLSSNVAVVAPSEWLASRARRSNIFDDISIDVVPNPLSTEFSASSESMVRSPNHNIVVAVVCSDLSDPLKKVREVVEAHQLACGRGSTTELKLIGKNVDGLANGKNVMWLGELAKDALQVAISEADYLVQASEGESFGLTVIEAASQGVSPIVRAGGSLEEIQRALGHGFTFKTRSELVDLFTQISADHRPRQSIRDELRSKSLRNFSSQKVEREYAHIYSRLGISP